MAGGADEAPRNEDVDDPPAMPKVVALRHAAMPEGAAPHLAPGAQRRHLTLVFVDLVDFTALATRLDPEDLQEILGEFHAAVADAVDRFGGRIVHLEGDGVLACFGWPSAHEDDAERAVRAALAAVAAVGQLQKAGGEALACRAGIATGTVVVVDRAGRPDDLRRCPTCGVAASCARAARQYCGG